MCACPPSAHPRFSHLRDVGVLHQQEVEISFGVQVPVDGLEGPLQRPQAPQQQPQEVQEEAQEPLARLAVPVLLGPRRKAQEGKCVSTRTGVVLT